MFTKILTLIHQIKMLHYILRAQVSLRGYSPAYGKPNSRERCAFYSRSCRNPDKLHITLDEKVDCSLLQFNWKTDEAALSEALEITYYTQRYSLQP
jgi:hypothetical protein